MGSGRRTSSSARTTRADRTQGSARTAAPRVAPLYKRLPHGPHRLGRNEVIANQRTRIHGAVRRVLSELMGYLADHPLHARTLAQEAFFAGPEALERVRYLAHSIATLLTEGAPNEAAGRLTTEAVAGAIWHTIRCQVAAGRPQLLAALDEQLAYIVLAPHIGAQEAAELLTQERPPVSERACAAARRSR